MTTPREGVVWVRFVRRSALVLVAVAACSGGDDGGDDTTTAPRDGGAVVRDGGVEPRDAGPDLTFCEARCDFEMRCNAGEISDYCGQDCEPWSALHRPEAIVSLEACLGVGEDCSVAGDEDRCFAMAADSAGTRDIDTMLRATCTTKHTACGDTFPVALCADESNVELYTESVISSLAACFAPAADCDGVLDCFLTTIPRLGN